MNGLKLVIGNKNGSSWSLRPWLLLKQSGLAFEEIIVALRRPDTARRIRSYSPSGKVPVLLAGDQCIWDSLAIAEFLAEQDRRLWPEDPHARAFARCVCAEMHSGFGALRTFLPMDFTARFGPPGMLLSEVGADIDRVLEIWAECRERHGRPGPFLFGSFTIVDAMFAPVCSRFTTYAIPLEPRARTYVAYMMALPAMLEWARGASAEVARLAAEAPTTAEEWDEAPSHELAAPSKLEEMVEPEPPPPMVMPEPPPVARANVEIETPPQPRPPPPAEAPPTRIMPTPIAPKEVDPTSDAAAAEAPTRIVRLPPVPQPVPKPAAAEPPPTRVVPRPTEPEPPARRQTPEPPPTRIAPTPAEPRPSPQAYVEQTPDDARRGPRAIPSTIMIKPIGDGTRRRR